LQIGAFSGPEAANKAAALLRSAGFNTQIEQLDSIYRTMVIGISAPDVYQASVRLGALGFGQIWVKE
jgi:cell division septation protein DedD